MDFPPSSPPQFNEKGDSHAYKKTIPFFPIGDTYVVIEILGDNYFYARATFNYMPYVVEGTNLNQILGTIIRHIKSDNRDFYTF